jgi:sugar transferase (PEP-CTERM/EpsH1 system associated)
VRILWVKSGGLVPLDHGGRIRSFHLASILAQTHDVSLFTFYPPTPDDTHAELRRIFSDVVCVPLRLPVQNSVAEYLTYGKNLFSMRPYSATKYCQPHVAEELRKHLQEKSYDIIICDFLLTAAVIPWDLPGPRVLFTHNVEAQIWERHFQIARNPVWKAACYREFRTIARMERFYLQQSEHVLAVSDADRESFSSFLHPSRISVIPTGVDVDYFQPAPEMEEQNTLVFTGSMDWLPNEDGISYFVEKILPLVRQQVPDAVLWVVGRRPSAQLEKISERDPNVKVTGRVDDIRPYMAKASVYVVPLLVGGGTRLKIFEAMAMGKAIVSTTIGAEGLPIESGKNIVLADEAEAFAAQIINLLRNSAKRYDLGCAARQLVEERYSWNSVGQELIRILNQVACSTAKQHSQTIQG